MHSSGIFLDSEVSRGSPSYEYEFYPLSNLSVSSSGLGTLPLVATVGSEVPGEIGMPVPSGAPSLGGTTQPTLRPTNELHRLLTGQIPAPLSHLSGNLSLGGLPKPNPFSLV